MTNSQTILVPSHFLEELAGRLEGRPVRLVPYDKHGNPLESSDDEADGLFRWWLTVEEGDRLITTHPRLDWIHTGSTGVDHILTPAFRSRAITLTSSRGVHAPSIAEWVVAAILHVEKRLDLIETQQKERTWKQIEVSELSSREVVILGGGAIGGEIARRLSPFGCSITVVTRSGQSDAAAGRTVRSERLGDVAANADWLIVAVPLTPETRAVIDASLLGRMRPSARIVNVARGEIIDERALEAALVEGRIAGAVLDVFEKEPLPGESPLWSLENVLVLPHTTWKSPETRERQLALFVRNVLLRSEGRTMENIVDVQRGY